tara:strand:+ start:65 stop:307 length:243 start_codon:yes stop_codon:yes gene_type:complete
MKDIVLTPEMVKAIRDFASDKTENTIVVNTQFLIRIGEELKEKRRAEMHAKRKREHRAQMKARADIMYAEKLKGTFYKIS